MDIADVSFLYWPSLISLWWHLLRLTHCLCLNVTKLLIAYAVWYIWNTYQWNETTAVTTVLVITAICIDTGWHISIELRNKHHSTSDSDRFARLGYVMNFNPDYNVEQNKNKNNSTRSIVVTKMSTKVSRKLAHFEKKMASDCLNVFELWTAAMCRNPSNVLVSTAYTDGREPLGLDDVMKWKHFPRYWPFVWGIHRSPVNFSHKGQWRGALMFSLICVGINGWVNNRKADNLRRHRAHYDVFVMYHDIIR